jgi:hypothetical protein
VSGALASTQKSGSVEVEFRKALRNGRYQPRAVKKAADKRSRGVRAGASDIGGKMDMPLAPAYAHGRLKAMYGDTPA